MEETMKTNKLQPVVNKSKKTFKNNTWKQVAVGGVSGVVLGGVATAAVAATTNDLTEGEISLEGVSGTAHVDSRIPVAHVSDEMSFGEAFDAAHGQVGPGGVFVWHGQVYGTYTADEWNNMTPAEQAEFGNRVHVVYDEPTQSTNANVQSTLNESHEIPSGTSANYDNSHQAAEPHTDNQEPVATVSEASGNTHDQVVSQVEPVVETTHEPQLEVLDYGTVTNEDGSQMDVAVVSVDGQEMGLYDVNQDGTADLLAVDANNDNQITSNEVEDISSEGISMQHLHNEFLAQNDPAMQGPDYINDGDVESYMA